MKKFFAFIILTALLAVAPTAKADGPWKVEFQNIKLPSQKMVEHQNWDNVATASASFVKSGAAISSVAATTITTFTAQPDYPRNITITPTGTTANVPGGTASVTGKNIFNQSVTEYFNIAALQSTATTGNQAFKSVSSVVFPVASNTGVTLSIGVGSKLGVRGCLARAGDYVLSQTNGTYDSTRGTIAANVASVGHNTFTSNSALNGSDVDLFYFQNYRCF